MFAMMKCGDTILAASYYNRYYNKYYNGYYNTLVCSLCNLYALWPKRYPHFCNCPLSPRGHYNLPPRGLLYTLYYVCISIDRKLLSILPVWIYLYLK